MLETDPAPGSGNVSPESDAFYYHATPDGCKDSIVCHGLLASALQGHRTWGRQVDDGLGEWRAAHPLPLGPPVLKNITLTRPLAIFDLETTGLDAMDARIVEVCILKLVPDGSRDLRTRRVNPGVPIPPECTAVH